MRGQIFSLDFVIAVAILTVAMGVTLQSVDNFQKRMLFIEQSQTNNAESIAQTFIRNTTGFRATVPYCFQYYNGSGNFTGDCAAFSCGSGSVFTSVRLTSCKGSAFAQPYPCSLTIMTCS